MANCRRCDNEYDSDWKAKGFITGFCSKCETKPMPNFWGIYRQFYPFANNLEDKPEILTSDQEAQVSRLVNTYGMEREDAITSLRKYWARSN